MNPRLLLVLALFAVAPFLFSQQFDTSLYESLEYRNIGPFRGGRSAAVSGAHNNPLRYYFGATGGGVWQTDDGGQSWFNISDGFFGGSIGAVAVSEWDPNVIYVGGGEVTVRGNVSHGYGMFRSTDAGKTWKSIGLTDTRHIPRIQIHPKNPDIVYVAALGHLFGPNDERGIFRSKNGGETWEKILFVNDEVGAVDLHMDPTNPRILYASMWRVLRTPYSLESGGEGSSIWKSTDGGDTWSEISANDGMPKEPLGISGITVSPKNPDRIWAIIEAPEGGVFRSENGGKSWKRINEDRNLRQRAWYYTRIYADPKDEDVVYVLNVSFWKSKDGGKTFESIRTPHGDHHDLWINPDNPQNMIIADDGGAQISFDGGENWSTYHNQPTAQFYRVITDNHFPYRIYGGQQDNSTVRISHRSDRGNIDEDDWEPTAGGESGFLAIHPDNDNIVYGGSYGGYLERLNHETKESRLVDVWPDNPMGHGAIDLKYRFQWNFPILTSFHDSNVLYTAANVLFKTMDEGQSWEAISPDLTRADPSTLGSSGGEITKDNTSVEYYATIFAVAESPHDKNVLWAGSDDGLIHVTKNGGATWDNVTPKGIPEWLMINSIDVHPTEAGGAYVAGTRYKSDDFQPYLFKTIDFGKSWTRIDKGIDREHFTRVLRADPQRKGLLYAGTESGMYISFDDGNSWTSFQLNLPTVPITDLAIKDDDLIVATQGRSFWILDDLTLFHQLNSRISSADFWVFNPRPTYLIGGGGNGSRTAGKNAPNGVVLRYYLKEKTDSTSVQIKILEQNGTLIKAFNEKDDNLSNETGLNTFVWNMRYPDATRFDGLILWAGGTQGPRAIPGDYLARIIVDTDSMTVPFKILPDPRSSATLADLQAQFDFLSEVRNKLDETHNAIKDIRSIRTKINKVITDSKEFDEEQEIKKSGEAIIKEITKIEESLYQTKNRSGQDPLNFPIKLNNRLSALSSTVGVGNFKPTAQAQEVKNELTKLIDAELMKLKVVLESEIPSFNLLVRSKAIPVIQM